MRQTREVRLVPCSLEALPANDPFRVAIRERACSLLVARGYLTAEDLRTLPVQTAITMALCRCRDGIGRTDQERANLGPEAAYLVLLEGNV